MVSVASSLPTEASGPGSWPETTAAATRMPGQPLDVAAGHQVGDPVALELGERAAEVAGELDGAVGVGQAEVAGVEPLGGEHGQRDLPALADRAEPEVVGELDPVEVDLVEGAAAGHLADRPHGDAGRVHRHQEDGEPGVLGRGRVGAGHRDAEVGDRRAGGPHLVAVEHPVAVALDGPGADGGEVGARPRSRRTAGRRSGRCAASPARSAPAARGCPTARWRGRRAAGSPRTSRCGAGRRRRPPPAGSASAYDVGRSRPPYSSGQVSAPQPASNFACS